MTATAEDVKRMLAIRARFLSAGLTVMEVDGWRGRGRPKTFRPVGCLEHHDGSSVKSGPWGAIGIITRGRDSIPGPLAQFQVSRAAHWAIVACGRCNHAGAGGPMTRAGVTIPKDSANRYTMGVEVANAGIAAGKRGHEPYTALLHESLDIGLACILEVVVP